MKLLSTITILFGSLLVYALLPDAEPVLVFRFGTWAFGLVLLIALGLEATAGLKQMLRVDIAILALIYGFTFAEFLLPKLFLMLSTTPEGAQSGVTLVLIGFSSVAVGRHFISSEPPRRERKAHLPNVSENSILLLMTACLFVGLLHVFVSTGFDISEIISAFGKNRWDRPWSRGMYGDATTLLFEMRVLIYIIPPICGVILARAREHSKFVIVLSLAELFIVLGYAFTEGTRNIFVILIILLCAAYFVASKRLTVKRFISVFLVGFITIAFGSAFILGFRNVGLSEYMKGGESVWDKEAMIDNNLFSISMLSEVFPNPYPYLGTELIVRTITLPVPRVIWPTKPQQSIEVADALGLSGLTITSTFIGEGYMSFGYLGVVLFGFAYGAFGSWWSRFRIGTSNLDIAFYASGFFAAAIGTRSILFVLVAFIPTVAIWVIGTFISRRRGRIEHRFSPPVQHAARPRRGEFTPQHLKR